MNLDIGKAFTFVTEDQKWVTKLLIGGGLLLAGGITIIGWIFTLPVIFGYLINLTRNVINGNPQPLPEWDNWGERWIEGVKVWAVVFVYYLPFGIVAFILGGGAGILSASSNSGVAALGTTASIAVNVCLAPLLGFVFAVIFPAAIGRLAVAGSIGDAFKIGDVLATVRSNIGTYIVIALLGSIVSYIIAGIGLIACLIGVFFTLFYVMLMNFHLYGQAQCNVQGAPVGYGQQPMYGEPRPF